MRNPAATILTACLSLLVFGCSGGGNPSLSGGGSTLVGPLMTKWATDYGKLKNIEIDYALKGSGNGIQQMTEGNYDFGCTDAPMNPDELERAKKHRGEVVHVPLVFGGVAIVYNLPEINDAKENLQLSAGVLADIYLGKITKWNDPAIQGINPGLTLPDRGVVVVRRAEPSGTTFIFTDYLANVSKEWEEKVGPGAKDLGSKWPTGSGQPQSQGVAGHVKATPGAIGYVELAFAMSEKLRYAAMQNKSGKFVTPEAVAVSAAGKEAMASIPDDLCLRMNNQPGEASYPICGTVWAVLYAKPANANKGKAVVEFLRWCVHDGQKIVSDMHYAPLPDALVQKVEERLKGAKGQ
jgi:phosphate transport system substrate-binding protein